MSTVEMTIDPIRIYDYLTISRQRIFDAIRPLSAEKYLQEFPIGLNSIGRTLTHIMICEWYYMQRVQELDVPPYETWPIQDEKPPPFAVLESTWTQQAHDTRTVLENMRNWSKSIQFRGVNDDNKHVVVTASAADLFTQLPLHEIHHRAQVLHMLRQLGVSVGDIDYGKFMFTRREVD